MFAEVVETEQDAELCQEPVQAPQQPSIATEYVALQEMEAIISAGEERHTFYRVEAGSLLVVVGDDQGDQSSCVVAGPGDYVGLGFLSTHTTSAHALTETTVSCYPASRMTELSALDRRMRSQLPKDTQREFASRRALMLSDRNRATPIQKVTRLILALSGHASREGCALHGVSDALDSEFTASLMGIDVELFTTCINDLAARRLIKRHPNTGFLEADAAGLEELA